MIFDMELEFYYFQLRDKILLVLLRREAVETGALLVVVVPSK